MTTTPEQAVIQAALLPCPFCGGEAKCGEWEHDWYMRCDTDGCWAETYGALYASKSEAIAAWNTRLAHSKPAEGLRELLREMFDAMVRYEMDVDADAPAAHRDMMERARAALQPLTEPQRLGQEGERCITCQRVIKPSAYKLPWCGACVAGETEESAEALSAPAQVAWLYENADQGRRHVVQDRSPDPQHMREKGWTETPLYALTPAQAEPVAWTGSGSLSALAAGQEGHIWPDRADAHPIPLYAQPPAPLQDREALERIAAIAAYHWRPGQVKSGTPRYYDLARIAELANAALDAALPLLNRAQALADLAEGDAELVGGER